MTLLPTSKYCLLFSLLPFPANVRNWPKFTALLVLESLESIDPRRYRAKVCRAFPSMTPLILFTSIIEHRAHGPVTLSVTHERGSEFLSVPSGPVMTIDFQASSAWGATPATTIFGLKLETPISDVSGFPTAVSFTNCTQKITAEDYNNKVLSTSLNTVTLSADISKNCASLTKGET
jgi:hypothetical protein